MPTQKSVRFDLSELQAQINEEQQRHNVLSNITVTNIFKKSRIRFISNFDRN